MIIQNLKNNFKENSQKNVENDPSMFTLTDPNNDKLWVVRTGTVHRKSPPDCSKNRENISKVALNLGNVLASGFHLVLKNILNKNRAKIFFSRVKTNICARAVFESYNWALGNARNFNAPKSDKLQIIKKLKINFKTTVLIDIFSKRTYKS